MLLSHILKDPQMDFVLLLSVSIGITPIQRTTGFIDSDLPFVASDNYGRQRAKTLPCRDGTLRQMEPSLIPKLRQLHFVRSGPSDFT